MNKFTKRRLSIGSGASTSAGFHSVLVPLDLTSHSDRILGRIALLPLAEHGRVTLLHVVPSALAPRDQRRMARDAMKVLEEEAWHLRKLLRRQIGIEPLVRVSPTAAKEIAAQAAKLQAELIVMGRGKGGTLRDAFVGSTAERVIRQARLPVLVVRLPARGSYRRPALALDLDAAAPEVVRLMLRVLSPPRPQIDVIHAFDVLFDGLIYRRLPDEEILERREKARALVARDLAKVLDGALADTGVLPGDGPFWRAHIRLGPPRSVVQKILKKSDADLLVMGTRARTGAAYMFLGTVAGDLLRAAQCDVLIVPPASRR